MRSDFLKVVAFVPIKLNNERLPNKNIKSFDNGKPLVHYILNTLGNISEIDKVYVYCSNEKIVHYIPAGVTVLKRSKHLDGSEISMNEVIQSFMNDVEADVYILSHATAPFLKEESIRKGLNKVLNEGYDSAFSAHKLQEFLWKNQQPFNYDPTNIPRTQDLEPFYSETCGFYIFGRELFTKYNRRIGFTPYIVEVNQIEGIDIDVMEDFDIANAIYNFFFQYANARGEINLE